MALRVQRRMVDGMVALALALGGSPAWAGSDELESLRGLAGVEVVIGQLAPAQVQRQMPPRDLRAELELTLAAAGITIIPAGENTLARRPQLEVAVCSLREENGVYYFSVSLELKQVARLPGLEGAVVVGTWRLEACTSATPGRLEVVRQLILDLAARFVADFKLTNPGS